MSQKSSLPQPARSVSRVLTADIAAVVSIEVGRKRVLFGGGDRCRSITRVLPRADQSLQ
jgi:hypothetical protein